MTRTISRSFALLGLGLALTACAQHNPAQANCFNFRDAPAQAAAATTTISTMGAEVTRRDTACDFVMLGTGN
jgi:ABC-type glycerol-3-phosphate transport system substrate-binding protein